MDDHYHVPLSLTVIALVFLCFGLICSIIVTVDIVVRKGWRSMMPIMIPVYIINALYLGPITMYLYYRYGRAAKPTSTVSPPAAKVESPRKPSAYTSDSLSSGHSSNEKLSHNPETAKTSCCSSKVTPAAATKPCCSSEPAAESDTKEPACCQRPTSSSDASSTSLDQDEKTVKSCCSTNTAPAATCTSAAKPACGKSTAAAPQNPLAVIDDASATSCCKASPTDPEKALPMKNEDTNPAKTAHGCCSSNKPQRPQWATVLAGVSHCGAGCVLGDLVGEWLVWGTGARINGQMIWAELLIDYAFALLFGICFQYFSIAPMSGEWGPMTIWRAAKADVASLTAFEIGAFSWMIASQVGIWEYRLGMDTWCYWWQMQVGMAMGAATGFPANWWLLNHKVKEPCC